jgi:hypothetical protein
LSSFRPMAHLPHRPSSCRFGNCSVARTRYRITVSLKRRVMGSAQYLCSVIFLHFIVPSLTFCSVVLLCCSSTTDGSRDLCLPRRLRAMVAPACLTVSSAAPRSSSSSRPPPSSRFSLLGA